MSSFLKLYIVPILFFLAAGTVSCEASTYTVKSHTVNVRSGPSAQYAVIGQLHKGATIEVINMHDRNWAEIEWKNSTGFINRQYLAPVEETQNGFSFYWKHLLNSAGIYIRIGIILFLILVIWPIIKHKNVEVARKRMFLFWYIISLPFHLLTVLQFWLAKPWRPLMKWNILPDTWKKPTRIFLRILQIPLYIALFPLRLINAVYYNLIIHNLYEWSNYVLEVIAPSDPREGSKGLWEWMIFLPRRIFKYLLFHGSLTLIESVVWTVVDTFLPAVTLYHGTDVTAADNMLCEPKRNHLRRYTSNRLSGTWTVGGGNYAGDGIYFGIFRKTLRNYQSGSAIVARVTMGKTIDTVLMPNAVYNQAGHPNASAVSNWGLNNGYTAGEWWRTSGSWWEICLFDRKNKYNDSWRIRPIYAVSYNSGMMQRIPGGSAHWLFRRMLIKDLRYSIKNIFR